MLEAYTRGCVKLAQDFFINSKRYCPPQPGIPGVVDGLFLRVPGSLRPHQLSKLQWCGIQGFGFGGRFWGVWREGSSALTVQFLGLGCKGQGFGFEAGLTARVLELGHEPRAMGLGVLDLAFLEARFRV